VKPEKVTDVEAGVDLRTKTLTLSANLYFMEFRNEIALTGSSPTWGFLSAATSTGATGAAWSSTPRGRPLPWLRANAALNVSRNRIREWTQFYDVYDAEGSWVGSTSLTHADVQPLLTPELVVNLGVDVSPVPWLAVGLRGRHVNRSFLDNTNHEDLVAPSYANLNAGVTVDLVPYREGGTAPPAARRQQRPRRPEDLPERLLVPVLRPRRRRRDLFRHGVLLPPRHATRDGDAGGRTLT